MDKNTLSHTIWECKYHLVFEPKYLDENDTEGLKSMFCNLTAETEEFDEQIQKAIVFYQGKNISYGTILTSGGRTVDEGITTRLRISPSIDDVETDAGKTYEIKFYSYLINTEYEDKVGVCELKITADDGEESIVGEYIR